MKNIRPVLACVVCAALIPSAALAAKPPKPPKPPAGSGALSLAVSRSAIAVPEAVTISGVLSGASAVGGVSVTLEQDDTRPYGDTYKAVAGAKAVTNAAGAYGFTQRPQKNTQYRVVAKASPTVTSAGRLVGVRPFVGLKASTRTPVARRTVRFSGLVQPARTGATVLLQRRTATGGFATVRSGVLRASTTGSVFTIAARVTRSGAYRVKLPGTLELLNGFSRTLKITTR
ncbi:MAG: hypothetical protein JWM31_2675 [Solirubrobacterales bacterium]|nr:hypothetical protein [Solirubrobacterales bacterium]